jgi:hypothetical protein
MVDFCHAFPFFPLLAASAAAAAASARATAMAERGAGVDAGAEDVVSHCGAEEVAAVDCILIDCGPALDDTDWFVSITDDTDWFVSTAYLHDESDRRLIWGACLFFIIADFTKLPSTNLPSTNAGNPRECVSSLGSGDPGSAHLSPHDISLHFPASPSPLPSR